MPGYGSGPKVSVIIPTFNRGWILTEAIQSVVDQTFNDYELIVVDDGSTDNTEKILTNFNECLQVVYQENKGVSSARNRGASCARGELIAFLDSDDLWMPEKLSKQVEFFNSIPKAVICQTEEIWIRNGVYANKKKYHKKISGDIFISSLARCIVSPSAVMMKKDFFDSTGGFDETMPACEDYDLWLRIGMRHPVHLLKEELVVKRGGHADQLSRSPGLDRFRIHSLIKIIKTEGLESMRKARVLETLQKKIDIYKTGCIKRGRDSEAEHYETIMEKLL